MRSVLRTFLSGQLQKSRALTQRTRRSTGETCKGRRSAERLSYWPELGWRALTRREKDMRRWFAVNNKCFPMAAKVVIRLLLALLMALTLALSSTLQAQGPALTTISDTVYRADGTAASGTVLISWPSFQSAGGNAVAAGNLSVTIGPLAGCGKTRFEAGAVPRNSLVSTVQPDKKKACEETTSSSWMCSAT